MLVADLPRFAVIDELYCSLNWQATVRRRVHNYRRVAGIVVGRLEAIIVDKAESLEFVNNK